MILGPKEGFDSIDEYFQIKIIKHVLSYQLTQAATQKVH